MSFSDQNQTNQWMQLEQLQKQLRPDDEMGIWSVNSTRMVRMQYAWHFMTLFKRNFECYDSNGWRNQRFFIYLLIYSHNFRKRMQTKIASVVKFDLYSRWTLAHMLRSRIPSPNAHAFAVSFILYTRKSVIVIINYPARIDTRKTKCSREFFVLHSIGYPRSAHFKPNCLHSFTHSSFLPNTHVCVRACFPSSLAYWVNKHFRSILMVFVLCFTYFENVWSSVENFHWNFQWKCLWIDCQFSARSFRDATIHTLLRLNTEQWSERMSMCCVHAFVCVEHIDFKTTL